VQGFLELHSCVIPNPLQFKNVNYSKNQSKVVHALDCTTPEGFVCVAPDRERDNVCDSPERYNIPIETAQDLDVFANSCS